MQPKDYLLNVPNPAQDVMGSVGQALSLKTMMENREMNKQSHAQNMEMSRLKQGEFERQVELDKQARAAQAQAQAQARARQQKVAKTVQYVTNNPNLSGQDLMKVFAEMPEVGVALNKAQGMLTDYQKKDLLNTSIQLETLFESGQKDKALELLDTKITAAEEAGDDQRVAALKSNKVALDAAGDNAAGITRILQVGILGAKDYTKNRETMASVDVKMVEKDMKKQDITKAKAETAQLLRGSPIALTKDGEKLVNESVMQATKSLGLSEEYDKLANRIKKEIETAGVGATAAEAWKKFWGNENKVTKLRQDYRRLKNAAVLDMLPPGVASDKDIEIAMGAFPTDTSSPQLVASFMSGMAKLQKHTSKIENEKADWVTKVGNLGASNTDIVIQGKTVPAGTRFTDYMKGKVGASPKEDTPSIPTYDQAKEKYPNMTIEAYKQWAKTKGA